MTPVTRLSLLFPVNQIRINFHLNHFVSNSSDWIGFKVREKGSSYSCGLIHVSKSNVTLPLHLQYWDFAYMQTDKYLITEFKSYFTTIFSKDFIIMGVKAIDR